MKTIGWHLTTKLQSYIRLNRK